MQVISGKMEPTLGHKLALDSLHYMAQIWEEATTFLLIVYSKPHHANYIEILEL
jgi:hypothetical protein